MRKIFFLTVLQLCVCGLASAQNQVTLTTYYPAPSGSYDRLRLVPRATISGTNCNVGTIYYDTTTKTIKSCVDDGVDGEWSQMEGVWRQAGNNVVISDASSPSLKKVAVGTQTPEFMLTLDADGGIIAKGTMGDSSAKTLTTAGAGTRLIWYPKKAALRAGNLTSLTPDRWDDANIGNFSVAFGQNNKASGIGSGVLSGDVNRVENYYDVVAGGSYNKIVAVTNGAYNFIGAGSSNDISGTSGQANFIGAGLDNNITSSVINGIVSGQENNIQNGGGESFIGAGWQNRIDNGLRSAIIAGWRNRITGDYNFIGNGNSNGDPTGGNVINASNSVIVGGGKNAVNANYSFIGVGGGHLIDTNASNSFIGAGGSNTINANSTSSFIGGGGNNTITTCRSSSILGGGLNTMTCAGISPGHVIGGGTSNTINADNLDEGNFIGGGEGNVAGPSKYTTIGGGETNTATGDHATIAGGHGHTAAGNNSFIGGGDNNRTNGIYSTIVAGNNNVTSGQSDFIGAGSGNQTNNWGVVVGGGLNSATNVSAFIGAGNQNVASGRVSVVGGGAANQATADWSFIGSGDSNTASGENSVIAGGANNTTSNFGTVVGGGHNNIASGLYAAIPGGQYNTAAGDYSLAAGRNMQLAATADNTIALGTSDVPLSITTPDAFIIFNSNLSGAGYAKVGIGMTNPAFPIEAISGAKLTVGGVWTDASSREYKEDISLLSRDEALKVLTGLQPVTFQYKTEKNDQHVGFIAEEVPDLVATPDRKGLSPMDIVAVVTKVVQEQQKQIDQQKIMLEEQRREIDLLKQKMKEL